MGFAGDCLDGAFMADDASLGMDGRKTKTVSLVDTGAAGRAAVRGDDRLSGMGSQNAGAGLAGVGTAGNYPAFVPFAPVYASRAGAGTGAQASRSKRAAVRVAACADDRECGADGCGCLA